MSNKKDHCNLQGQESGDRCHLHSIMQETMLTILSLSSVKDAELSGFEAFHFKFQTQRFPAKAYMQWLRSKSLFRGERDSFQFSGRTFRVVMIFQVSKSRKSNLHVIHKSADYANSVARGLSITLPCFHASSLLPMLLLALSFLL